MRILLLSDSHKCTNVIDRVLSQCGPVDLIVHCGDVDSDCDYLTYVVPAAVPQIAVCGNNDYQSLRPFSFAGEIGGLRLYVTHGHLEHVKAGTEGLLRAARANNCQLVFYGHTHRALDETVDGIRMVNPGALSGLHPTYAVITLEKGNALVHFYNVHM